MASGLFSRLFAGKTGDRKAVFLDRDGTLNLDPGYISDPDRFEILPGVPAALRLLQDAGYLLVVVSNQSGVGRGLIKPEDLGRVHAKLDRILAEHGVKIAEYALCFHRPEEDCECRKPKTKLVLDSARRNGIDLARSFMVGDKRIDLECGRAAGVRESFLVGTGNGAEEAATLPADEKDRVFMKDLRACAERILSLDNS
jgi:histidinol-phosphate phosphatase family protein